MRNSELIEDAFWRAVVLAQQAKHPHLLATARAFQTRYWLTQNNMQAAREFQSVYRFIDGEEYLFQHEEVALTLLRVLLAQG